MEGVWSKIIMVSIITLVAVSLVFTWQSQPDTIVWMDQDATYQFTEESNSTINIHIRLFQEHPDELVLLVTYLDSPPVAPIIQINRTYFSGAGEQIALLKIDSDNYRYVISNIFGEGSNGAYDSVSIIVNIKYYEGYFVYPVHIDSTDQKLESSDIASFILKFSFPLLLLYLPAVQQMSKGASRKDDMQIFKELLALSVLSIIVSFYIPIIFYLLLAFLSWYTASLLVMRDPTTDHSIFYAFILMIFTINATPLSLGSGPLSMKMKFLHLEFLFYPYISLLVLFVLGIFLYHNTKTTRDRAELSLTTVIYGIILFAVVMIISRSLF